MHTHLLTNVIRWPMEVFDQTPIGRILNRFSKEIEVVDVTLPQNLRSWLLQFFSVTSRFSAFLKLRFPLKLPVHLVTSLLKMNNLCHRWRGRAEPFLFAQFHHLHASRHATQIDYDEAPAFREISGTLHPSWWVASFHPVPCSCSSENFSFMNEDFATEVFH